MPPDASQGHDPPQGSQGDDAPKFVTEEQLNKAITGRLADWSKSFEKKNAETIKSVVGEIAPQLDKLLEEKLAAFRPAEGVKAGGGNAHDAAKVDIENHPAFKGMKKQLDEAVGQTRKLQEERDAERARARDMDLRKQVTETFAKNGVPADRLHFAVGAAIDTEKKAKWNEDGDAVVFGDLDLDTGSKDWLKSDNAKIFLLPRGTQGSGERGGGRAPAARSSMGTKAVSMQDLGNAVLQSIPSIAVPR